MLFVFGPLQSCSPGWTGGIYHLYRLQLHGFRGCPPPAPPPYHHHREWGRGGERNWAFPSTSPKPTFIVPSPPCLACLGHLMFTGWVGSFFSFLFLFFFVFFLVLGVTAHSFWGKKNMYMGPGDRLALSTYPHLPCSPSPLGQAADLVTLICRHPPLLRPPLGRETG